MTFISWSQKIRKISVIPDTEIFLNSRNPIFSVLWTLDGWVAVKSSGGGTGMALTPETPKCRTGPGRFPGLLWFLIVASRALNCEKINWPSKTCGLHYGPDKVKIAFLLV